MGSINIGSDADGNDVIDIMPGNTWDAQEHDSVLVEKAAQGDRVAFEALFVRHHARVKAIAQRMLRNAAEADELAQEVFVQLCRYLSTFRGESAFTTWLHSVTVNQVCVHLRRKSSKLRPFLESLDADPDGFDRPGPPPTIADRIALEEAMDKLPRGLRAVFILHDVNGFDHEEIARILGCSASTSKSQLHRARLKLRKLLEMKANPRVH